MNKYCEFQKKQNKELNTFLEGKLILCFADEDLEEKKEEAGIEKLVYIGLSCFINAEYYEEFVQMRERQEKEYHDFLFSAEENLRHALRFEFANHENYINCSYMETAQNVLGLSKKEIKENKQLIKETIREYEAEVEF